MTSRTLPIRPQNLIVVQYPKKRARGTKKKKPESSLTAEKGRRKKQRSLSDGVIGFRRLQTAAEAPAFKSVHCSSALSSHGPYSLGVDPAARTFHACLYDIPTDNIVGIYWADFKEFNTMRAPNYEEMLERAYTKRPYIFLRENTSMGIESQANLSPTNCCIEAALRARFRNVRDVYIIDPKKIKKLFPDIGRAEGRAEKKRLTCSTGRKILKPHEVQMVDSLRRDKIRYVQRVKDESGRDCKKSIVKDDDLFDAIFIALAVAQIRQGADHPLPRIKNLMSKPFMTEFIDNTPPLKGFPVSLSSSSPQSEHVEKVTLSLDDDDDEGS